MGGVWDRRRGLSLRCALFTRGSGGLMGRDWGPAAVLRECAPLMIHRPRSPPTDQPSKTKTHGGDGGDERRRDSKDKGQRQSMRHTGEGKQTFSSAAQQRQLAESQGRRAGEEERETGGGGGREDKRNRK